MHHTYFEVQCKWFNICLGENSKLTVEAVKVEVVDVEAEVVVDGVKLAGSLAAHLAWVGFLTDVDALGDDQVARCCESLPTFFALVGLFSSVHVLVCRHGVCTRKRFAILLAFEQLLTSMNVHVLS